MCQLLMTVVRRRPHEDRPDRASGRMVEDPYANLARIGGIVAPVERIPQRPVTVRLRTGTVGGPLVAVGHARPPATAGDGEDPAGQHEQRAEPGGEGPGEHE